MTISSTNTKNSYSGDGTTVAFSYTFKILDDDDIQVILRTDATGTETVQTKTTDYTVSGVGNAGGGTITFGSAPAATETVVLLRNVPLTQTTDYTPNDPFPAATHEDALDKLTLMAQDTQEEVDRSIKLSRTNTMTSTEFTVGATTRANKIFAFDSSGELAVTQEIGTFQGDWAASTAYAERDLVKDTSTNNIFIVNSAHTSSGSQPLTTNPNSSKYDLIVDAAAATTSATNAASSATAAAASATAAAASESAAATSETNAAASEAGVAADAAAAAASAASASTSATNASTSETNASNSASAASTSATNAATSATSASNSASSAGTSESNAATSATNASNSASAAATSASNAATSESNASTSETNAASSASSAASDASAAATSAAAAAASFDAFDDIYLGAKASAPTQDNDGDALTNGDLYFDTGDNELYIWNGSAWQAASPNIVADTTPQLGGDLDTNGNDINFGDNDKAIFGAGSDLQIWHNGSDSFIVDNGTGDLILKGASNIKLQAASTNEDMITATSNGAVNIYYNNNQKLATTSTGIDVTGTVTADGLTVDGDASLDGTAVNFIFNETDTTDLNTRLRQSGALFSVATVNDSGSSPKAHIVVNNSLGDISFYDNTGTSQGFYWDASTQELGIGTTSPSKTLTVHGNDGTPLLLQGSGNDTAIAFAHSGTSNAAINASSDGALEFRSGGVGSADEAMRIDSSGNLLVGMITPSNLTTGFAARANSLNSFCRDTATTDAAVLAVNKKTGDGDIVIIQKDGTTVGSIGTGGTANFQIYNAQASHVGLEFGSPNIMPTNNGGSLTDGGAALGSSSYRFSDLYLSGGVYLGGTGSANLLDDYEEGTWTPVVQGGSSAGSYTLNLGSGNYNEYVKVGDMVTVWGFIQISSVNSAGSGDWVISGLPFNKRANFPAACGVRVKSASIGTSDTTNIVIDVATYSGQTDQLNIRETRADGTENKVNISEAVANAELSFIISYIVA